MKSELNAPHLKNKNIKLSPPLLKNEKTWGRMRWNVERFKAELRNEQDSQYSSLFTDRNTTVEYSEIPLNDPTQRAIAKVNGNTYIHINREDNESPELSIESKKTPRTSHITHMISCHGHEPQQKNPKPTTATQRKPPWQVNPLNKIGKKRGTKRAYPLRVLSSKSSCHPNFLWKRERESCY